MEVTSFPSGTEGVSALIAGEVLAVEYGPGTEGTYEHADADLGLRFWLSRA